jgi:hypothetical protein
MLSTSDVAKHFIKQVNTFQNKETNKKQRSFISYEYCSGVSEHQLKEWQGNRAAPASPACLETNKRTAAGGTQKEADSRRLRNI